MGSELFSPAELQAIQIPALLGVSHDPAITHFLSAEYGAQSSQSPLDVWLISPAIPPGDRPSLKRASSTNYCFGASQSCPTEVKTMLRQDSSSVVALPEIGRRLFGAISSEDKNYREYTGGNPLSDPKRAEDCYLSQERMLCGQFKLAKPSYQYEQEVNQEWLN